MINMHYYNNYMHKLLLCTTGPTHRFTFSISLTVPVMAHKLQVTRSLLRHFTARSTKDVHNLQWAY